MPNLLTAAFGGLRRRLGLAGAGDSGTPAPSPGSALTQLFGDSKLSADVRKAIGSFSPRTVGMREFLQMRDDPDVAFGMAILRAPIINLRWSVESKDPVIAAFIEGQLRRRYRQFAKAATNAIGLGLQVVEKVWEPKPLKWEVEDKAAGTTSKKSLPMAWTIRKYKAIDPRTISLLVDKENDEWAGVEQIAARGNPVRVGTDRTVLWSFRDEDVFGRLEGYPILRHAYEHWYWKAAMNMFANRYFERRADPTPKARASSKAIPDAGGGQVNGMTHMGGVIMAMKQGAYVILPNSRDKDGNFEFELDYMLDDKRGDMYQQRIDKLGVGILRGLWITDRAGTSGGAGGIGTGEATAHMETLAGTLEMIVDEFLDEVLNPQVVDPLVEFNFGKEALEESQTRVKGAGLSNAQRELLTKVLLQLMTAEQFLANGKRVPTAARMDGAAILQELDLPMLSNDELEPLSEDEDPPPAGGGNSDDEDDDEEDLDPEAERAVAKRLGKRGVVDPDSREALAGVDAEMFDQVMKEVDRRVATVRAERAPEKLAGEADAGSRTVPIELHLHQGDTNVSVPERQTVVNPAVTVLAPAAAPVTVSLGDINATVQLRPGEKKTVKLKGPNGETITGEITLKGGS